MVEVSGTVKELGLVSLDGQLHLDHQGVLVHDVHQNVLGAAFQPVLDPHNSEGRVVRLVDALNLIVDGNDLVFMGTALAPEKVANQEGDEFRHVCGNINSP